MFLKVLGIVHLNINFYYRIHIMIMIERTTQNKIAKDV